MAFGQITTFKVIIVKEMIQDFKKVKVQNPSRIIDRIKWTLGMNYPHSELERVCAHSACLRPVQSSDIWRGFKLENLTNL